jgi:hypothetical protein
MELLPRCSRRAWGWCASPKFSTRSEDAMASALAWVLNLLGGWRQRRGARNEGDKLQMRASDRQWVDTPATASAAEARVRVGCSGKISASFFKGTGVAYLRPVRRSGPSFSSISGQILNRYMTCSPSRTRIFVNFLSYFESICDRGEGID